MIICARPGCQTSAGCVCHRPSPIGAPPSPRTLPVNLPFPSYGVTIATMDSEGNVTIKVDQPRPE